MLKALVISSSGCKCLDRFVSILALALLPMDSFEACLLTALELTSMVGFVRLLSAWLSFDADVDLFIDLGGTSSSGTGICSGFITGG